MIRGGNNNISNNNNNNITIERLPTDIISHIISYLSLDDILSFQGSSGTLRTAIGLERRDTDLSPFTAHHTGVKGVGRRKYVLSFGDDDDDEDNDDDVHTARLSLECRGFERTMLYATGFFANAVFYVTETEYPGGVGGGDKNNNEPKRRRVIERFITRTPIFQERVRRYDLEFRPKRGCVYALRYKVGGDVENDVEVQDITVRTYRRKMEGGPEQSGCRRRPSEGHQQHHHHHQRPINQPTASECDWWYRC